MRTQNFYNLTMMTLFFQLMTRQCLVAALVNKSQAVFGLMLGLLLVLSGCGHAPVLLSAAGFDQNLTLAPRYYPKTELGLVDIKSFDVYVESSSVHAVVVGSAQPGKESAVYYLRSEDGGRQWSKPVLISAGVDVPIAARGNDVQLAAANNKIVVLWQTRAEFPNQGPITGVYSSDSGKTWSKTLNPAENNAGDQAHLDLISDHQGYFHVVWLEDPEEHGYQSVRYARSINGGQAWETAKTLDDSTCSCCWNTLLVSRSGALNLLYRDMRPRDMALMQSVDDGIHWQLVSTVGQFNWQFEGCPHIGGGLAESSANVLHSVVWTGTDQKQGLYYVASDTDGKAWYPPYRLSKNALHGDIAAFNDRQLLAIWDEKGPEGLHIEFASSDDAGKTWHNPIALSDLTRVATHPKVVATEAGVLALWTEKSPKQPSQWKLVLFETQ